MANNEEKLMSELTFDEILEEIIKIDDMRMEAYYRGIEKEEALQEIVDNALSEGITIETEPQLSFEEAKKLERLVRAFEAGKTEIYLFEGAAAMEELLKTYMYVESNSLDSGGRIIDAHKWKEDSEEESSTMFRIVGVSPWLDDIHLTSLLSAAGYDYRED